MTYRDTPETVRANRRFLKRAMQTGLLDARRELELAHAWRDRGDVSALHELTQAYLRLVVAMAARYRNYGLPLGDLIQEGSLGLMQAAARFDPERGVRFSTYASWWIRSAIQDHVLRNWSIVRTGTTAAQKSLFFNLRRLRALIGAAGDSQLSPVARTKIARALRVDVHEVEAMEGRMAAPDRSLHEPISEDGEGIWQDLLEDEGPSPEEIVAVRHDEAARSNWIRRALHTLTPRERVVIRERRLRDDGPTLESLGRRLGISKERVRQIESIALEKLKAALIRDVPDPEASGLVPA